MAQAPEYLQASFRGVDFLVDGSSVSIGRRIALHEYVNQDIPYAEDMGRKAREYSVTAFVIGSDHLNQARALERALETGGAGELVLPSRQRDTVVVTDASRSDDTRREKLVTRFDITMIEAGALQFPSGFLSTIANLLETAAAAIDSIVAQITAPIQSLTAAVNRVAEAASTFGQSIQGISSIGDSVEALFDAITQITDINAAIGLTNFQSAVPPATNGPIAQAEYQEALAFDVAVRTAAALHAASLVTGLEFSSRREAIQIRDQINSALLADLGSLSYEQVLAVQSVQLAFITDIHSRIAVLPNFVRVDFGRSLPSVVAAHKIYCDWTRHEDLLEWNETYHPLFMPHVIEALR